LRSLIELRELGYVAEPAKSPDLVREDLEADRKQVAAKSHYSYGEFEKARSILDDLLDQTPGNLEARMQRINCSLRLKNIERAEEDLAILSEGREDNSQFSYLRGRIALLRGDAEGAEAAFKAAEEMNTRGRAGREIVERVASAHLAAKDLDKAEASYRRALNMDPHSPQSLSGLGRVMQLRGEHAGAIAQFQRSLSELRQQPLVHFYLGNSLMATGKPSDAAKAFKEALDIMPSMQQARAALTKAETMIAGLAVAAVKKSRE
jgi:tetratricopeptide (TPR) repeat protein